MKHTRFSIHPLAAAGLFLLFFATPRAYAFAVFTSVLLHEMGHLLAAKLFGAHAHGVCLMPTGISIALAPPRSYGEEIVVALAGPLMNFLYLMASPLLPTAVRGMVCTVTLTLSVLNLLPIKTMDGGRILHASLSFFFRESTADTALGITSAMILSALWILSLYVFFYSGANFALLLFCAYLFSFLIVKKL